jgi:RNA polymerase sigma factor (sigma-70 family)
MDVLEEALEGLYRARYVAFRNVVASATGDFDLARDIVQEGFARALARRETFRGDYRENRLLEAWVWRITLNLTLRVKREPSYLSLDDVPEPALLPSDTFPELTMAIRQLPVRRRLILFLYYFAELPYGEIARICHISEGTVAAALSQARATLLESLATRRHEVAYMPTNLVEGRLPC